MNSDLELEEAPRLAVSLTEEVRVQTAPLPEPRKRKTDFILNFAFIGMHVACVLVIWAGISWIAVGVCVALYVARMFGLTAGYHRYFAHRTYKTSRWFQFAMGWLGATALQNGPLWWAAHHRHHHRYSDTEQDVHSPVAGGFWWSHIGWILSKRFNFTNYKLVPDLAKFRELRFLNKYHLVPPITLAVMLFAVGMALQWFAPGLHTTGFQMLIWGFFISTTLLYHGTFTVNSIAHLIGRRRFNTSDDSRNNLFVALITLGEGWHNNHHRFMSSERQGFYWWEIDISHYILTVFSWLGLVWDLRTPPVSIYQEAVRSKSISRKFEGKKAKSW